MMRTVWVGLFLTLSVPGWAATPMLVTWPTWLRALPSEKARAIDELAGGSPVEVLSCNAGWCRVLSGQASGYLPQALLSASAPKAVQPTGENCVSGTHQTPERAIPLRICPGQ